jgi:hypothetical protein
LKFDTWQSLRLKSRQLEANNAGLWLQGFALSLNGLALSLCDFGQPFHALGV